MDLYTLSSSSLLVPAQRHGLTLMGIFMPYTNFSIEISGIERGTDMCPLLGFLRIAGSGCVEKKRRARVEGLI
jgi:hypothetical protein